MAKINLSETKGKSVSGRLAAAAEFLREHPGSTLVIDPGEYIITSERARNAQKSVMNGEYGACPQPVMFNPAYVYDRGLDLDGVKGARIEAYGAKFIIDGFMEPVSIRNCSNVELLGLTIDHLRKPYSRCTVKAVHGDRVTCVFGEKFPVTPNIPFVRACLCDREFTRLETSVTVTAMEYIDEHNAVFTVKGLPSDAVGRELYIWHTYHSRPAVLMENAVNTHIKDVTVHSQPGMGFTAHDSKDIFFERVRVVPSAGECMSTNTDATHITSCRGKLRYDNCLFEGQGDDTLDVHTYYHHIKSAEGNVITCRAEPYDGTHTQAVDCFKAGDTVLKVKADTLYPEERFTAVNAVVDPESGINTLTLDRPFGDAEGYFVSDYDSVPELYMNHCTMKDHLARGLLVKCRRAVVENCTFLRIFEMGMKIAAEESWREGNGTEDITVRGCSFVGCGHSNNLCGGIHMYAECSERTENIHKKITVENCLFDCPDAKHAMLLESVDEVKLAGNTVAGE